MSNMVRSTFNSFSDFFSFLFFPPLLPHVSFLASGRDSMAVSSTWTLIKGRVPNM